MQKRTFLVCGFSSLVIAGVAVAQNQGIQAVIGNVFLQNTTPGLVQAGHASIGGTFRAGQVMASQATATTVPIVGNNTAVGVGTSVGGSFSSAQQSGIGVRGTAVASIGRADGVYGESRSREGAGVHGKATSGSQIVGNFAAGILGESTNDNIPAIRAIGAAGTALAVQSSGGNTMTVINQSANSNTIYVNGGSSGIYTDGSVYGITAVGANGGTFGIQNNANGTACRGNNGQAVSSGYGVYGRHFTANGYAVFAEGKTGATGTKSFVIDHPADPTNKTLSHYCTEGEEPLNVYRGKVVTDGRGEAWVTLPGYFDEINIDPTVQLTVSDTTADFVMAKVARDVADRKFLIRTSKPNTKVFWRVEARRNDRWVRAYGAPVEAMKPEIVRGTYMRPELYGKPQTLSEDARRFPEADAKPPRP